MRHMIALRPHLVDRVTSRSSAEGYVGRAVFSVLAHVALVATLLRLMVPVPQTAREPLAFSLLFAPAQAPSKQAAPKAVSPIVVPAQQPQVAAISPPTPIAPAQRPVRVTRVKPQTHYPPATARRTSPAAPIRPSPAARDQTAVPAAAVAPAAPTLAIPTMVPDDGVALARLRGAVSEAVRAVATMPMAARLQRREGRAQVGFAYQDGTVAQATLLRSSQSRVLDEAALSAVRRARYPAPPINLRGRRLTLQVWIDFTVGAQTPS